MLSELEFVASVENDVANRPFITPWERVQHEGAVRFPDFRHFPRLIERGHVFVAKPPLFRVDAPARGKKPAAKIYALDDDELRATLDRLQKEGARAGSWSVSRFKGLGEMNAEQLWDTTLNPDTRRLLPIGFAGAGFAATAASLTKLMGKGEAQARRELMELRADAVEVDV
jgi:topoisomerase IV subunit B